MDIGVSLVLLVGGVMLGGVEGMVVPRAAVGSEGSPLLLGPNGGATTSTTNNNNKQRPSTSDTSTSDDSNVDDDNGGDDESTSTSASSSSPATTATASTSKPATTASTTSSLMTTTSTSTTTMTSQATSTSTSTSKADRDILNSGPSRQPSSVRYLVPVFLLILIAIVGFAYQKYRKRRKLSRRRSSASKEFETAMKKGQDPFGGDGGWEEVRDHDEDKEGYDEDDPWYAGDVEDAPQLKWQEGLKDSGTRYTFGGGEGLERSGGLVSAGAKGWGWKDSWNQFKSARGKLNEQAIEEERNVAGVEADAHAPVERRTMKLVTSPNLDPNPDYLPTDKSGEYAKYTRVPTTEGGNEYMNVNVNVNIEDHTYQDVPIIHHRPPTDQDDTNNKGSIRALRDKIASLTYKTPLSPDGKGRGGKQNLERNRSPNKRSTNPRSNTAELVASGPAPAISGQQVAVPPSPPAWIRPRAVSPPSMSILSPPMQPHLFFHPTPLPSVSGDGANKGIGHVQMITDDHSVSEYASDLDETETPIPSANPSPNPNADADADADTGSTAANHSAKSGTMNAKFPRIPSTASGLAGADSFSVVSNNKLTPGSTNPLKGNSGLSPLVERVKSTRSTSKLNPANGIKKVTDESGCRSGPSALALRRSAASKSLSISPTSPLSRRESKGKSNPLLSPKDIPESEIARSKSLARAKSKSDGKKTKTQRKEERARDKVEDILKASWSDRALASPPLGLTANTSGGGMISGDEMPQGARMIVPGLMSPGLEETGGIEQRLALLKNVVI
ncbi:hypothetical protein IAT40_004939 [Kwoniella sp. CBS 6097]